MQLATGLKKHFGNIDADKRKALEAHSWFNKARQMAAMDMFLNAGQISERSMELILALPVKTRAQVMVELKENGPLCYLEN